MSGDERRMRIYQVEERDMLSLLKASTGTLGHLTVPKFPELPAGYEVKGAYYDPLRRSFGIYVEHETFGIVPPGQCMPVMPDILTVQHVTIPLPDFTNTGLIDVGEECSRQIEDEGYTSEHDDRHIGGELAKAAIVYAADPVTRHAQQFAGCIRWPWPDGFKPCDDRERELVKAGALIVAEINRIRRARAKAGDEHQ